MEKDFSVAGREKFLANMFFNPPSKDAKWEFTFARWTLLERVIWEFKPEDTHCHLDGFDLDFIERYSNGFVGIGRVWWLPEPNSPGEFPVTMAVEFDSAEMEITRASVWIGFKTKGIIEPPKMDFSELGQVIEKENIGPSWSKAFTRKSESWSMNSDFDLSPFLMPNKEKSAPT